MKPKVLVINGSLGGSKGNTARLLEPLLGALEPRAELQVLHLAEPWSIGAVEANLNEAVAFVFATGTYWDSWGSPLQRFFEEATGSEATATWVGKPAACIVSMHSVGGKEVVSRLQGVLSTLGCVIPPMTGFAYSLAGHLALQGEEGEEFAEDLWHTEDLGVVAHNLLLATQARSPWRTWQVDRRDPTRLWFSS